MLPPSWVSRYRVWLDNETVRIRNEALSTKLLFAVLEVVFRKPFGYLLLLRIYYPLHKENLLEVFVTGVEAGMECP